jgi:glycosyltransferase involved in cell wall biosynthesis
MRILMLGTLIPDEEFKEKYMSNKFVPIQNHCFSWSIVRALESALKHPVDIFSLQPIETTFPTSPNIFMKQNYWKRENRGVILGLPFLNIPKIKSLSIFIIVLFKILVWSIRTYKQKRVVFQISLNSSFFFAVSICRIFFKIKYVLLVNDSPVNPLVKNKSVFHKKNHTLMYVSMKHVNGIIGVTEFVSTDFAPSVKSMIMECIAHAPKSDNEIETVQEEKIHRNEFIFVNVGSLYRQYGIQLLVDAFRLVKNPNVRLKIFGKGPMVSYIEEAAVNDSRIQYSGFVSNEEAIRQEMNADILVNPRPSNQEFVRYSFPIKLMEYLATGTAVVTTKLSCIPDEYEGLYIPIEDETPEGLAALLEKLAATPRTELHELGIKSAKFIRENKTETIQGKRMIEFIESLI